MTEVRRQKKTGEIEGIHFLFLQRKEVTKNRGLRILFKIIKLTNLKKMVI